MSDNNEDWGMTMPPRKLDDKAADAVGKNSPPSPPPPDDWSMTQANMDVPGGDFDKTTPNINLPSSGSAPNDWDTPEKPAERGNDWQMPRPVFRISAGETPNFEKSQDDDFGHRHEDAGHGGHTVPYYRLPENSAPSPASPAAVADPAEDVSDPPPAAPAPSGGGNTKWILALVGLLAFFFVAIGGLFGAYFLWFSGSRTASTSSEPAKPTSANKQTAAPTPAVAEKPATLAPSISYRGEMLLVAGGEFTMGSDSGTDEAKPSHKATVNDFYIDKYEVTNAQYKEFCDATKRPYPASQFWDEDYFTSRPNAPVLGVSFEDARAYAEWAGKRLPTEAEWEKAASWTASSNAKSDFPWGNSFDASKAAFNAEQPSDVGRFATGASPSGALDMSGNAAEWVDSFFSAYPGNTSSNPNFGESNRVVRGGHFKSKSNDSLTTTKRIYVPPGFVPDGDKTSYIGFRCAISADDPRISKSGDR
jgi:formylglycine-generating enzyme required for sulfatase activity